MILPFIKQFYSQYIFKSKDKSKALSLSLLFFTLLACQPEKEIIYIEVDFQKINLEPTLDSTIDYDVQNEMGLVIKKEFGEACSGSTDCISDRCISFGESGVCTKECLGDNCPEGWKCRGVANTGVDLLFLCAPNDDRLCKPCATSDDCPSGACIELDGVAVCAKNCLDNDCPEGYTCQEVPESNQKQCLPKTQSCSCNASKDQQERICEVSNDFGACIGRQTCVGDNGWTACSAQAPVQEICNQIDDDCNGLTDDIPGIGDVCTKDTLSEDGQMLVCTGRLLCTRDQEQPICTAQAPSAEKCNFFDDDCDGNSDEDFPQRDQVCTVGIGLCQRFGVYACNEAGDAVSCNVVPGSPADESCDGLDNDCDGNIDETFPNIGALCELGQGLCRSVGTVQCNADAQSASCTAVVTEGLPEKCDGLDNDCDGKNDEDYPMLNQLCTAGQGTCRQVSFYQCNAEQTDAFCEVDAGAAQAEACDGFDNDCDGKNDEDYPLLSRPCAVGIGLCFRQGVFLCTEDGLGSACSVTPGEPVEEICDGQDNNCNGDIDELWANIGQVCITGQGICQRSGLVKCPMGGIGESACDAEIVQGNAQELCDYQDDDCDGKTDETFVDAQNKYSLLDNCGSCGNSCNELWQNNPQSFGVQPSCVNSSNRFQCSYDCLPGFFDADGLSRNGCELAPDPLAIYVSLPQNGGNDTNTCGAINTPCATINKGITRANQSGKNKVLVSEGVYKEFVILSAGISLIGGHNRINWVQVPEVYVTQIDTRGLNSADTDIYAVKAQNILVNTKLDGFVINSGTPLSNGNSYGVYIIDSDEHLTISNNRIVAGDGGRGADGDSGISGRGGVSGGNGVNSKGSANTPVNCVTDPLLANFFGSAGGTGGSLSCDNISVSGGNGGQSSCPVFSASAFAGINGQGALAGLGGLGATHFSSDTNTRCSVPTGGRTDASSGTSGSAGTDGRGGIQQGVALGRITNLHWRNLKGGDGENGIPGGGGGGGGAAAGVVINWSVPGASNPRDIGATGGGGGSGGCAGARGVGGNSGGGSFGIFIAYQSFVPNNTSKMPVISANQINRGFGGAGGRGGNGGGGGEGGIGGRGGVAGNTVYMSFCSLQGGEGGSGGRGGHAGAGSGGNGGVSFDIFVAQANGLNGQHYEAVNQFSLDATAATAGLGGRGGNSSNVNIGNGQNGLNGVSGRIGGL